MWIPASSCLRLWFLWYMWMLVSFGNVQNIIFINWWILSRGTGPVIIGNTQRMSQCLSYYSLTSRHWMVLGFSFIILDRLENSWKPQVWSIVMGCQHPPRLRHAPLRTDWNGPDYKIYWFKSYYSVIRILLYLYSKVITNLVLLLSQIRSWEFSCPHNPAKYTLT